MCYILYVMLLNSVRKEYIVSVCTKNISRIRVTSVIDKMIEHIMSLYRYEYTAIHLVYSRYCPSLFVDIVYFNYITIKPDE